MKRDLGTLRAEGAWASATNPFYWWHDQGGESPGLWTPGPALGSRLWENGRVNQTLRTLAVWRFGGTVWVQQVRIAPSSLGGAGRQGHRCKIRDSYKISLQASTTVGPAIRGGRHRFRFSWCDEQSCAAWQLCSRPISALKGSLECDSPSFFECNSTWVTVGIDYRQFEAVWVSNNCLPPTCL